MNCHNDRVNDRRGREYVLKTLGEIGVLLGGKNSADGAVIFENLFNEFELSAPVLMNRLLQPLPKALIRQDFSIILQRLTNQTFLQFTEKFLILSNGKK